MPPAGDHNSLSHLPAGFWFLGFLIVFEHHAKRKSSSSLAWHSGHFEGSSQPHSPLSSHPASCPHSSPRTHQAPPVPVHRLFLLPTRPFPPLPSELHLNRYLGVCLASLRLQEALGPTVWFPQSLTDVAQQTTSLSAIVPILSCFTHASIHKVGAIITPTLQLIKWRQRGKPTYPRT